MCIEYELMVRVNGGRGGGGGGGGRGGGSKRDGTGVRMIIKPIEIVQSCFLV